MVDRAALRGLVAFAPALEAVALVPEALAEAFFLHAFPTIFPEALAAAVVRLEVRVALAVEALAAVLALSFTTTLRTIPRQMSVAVTLITLCKSADCIDFLILLVFMYLLFLKLLKLLELIHHVRVPDVHGDWPIVVHDGHTI